MEYRMEHDTMGQVAVPADKLWGAQTQRSFENFPIGEEKMPADLITAFGVLKEACAAANHKLGKPGRIAPAAARKTARGNRSVFDVQINRG